MYLLGIDGCGSGSGVQLLSVILLNLQIFISCEKQMLSYNVIVEIKHDYNSTE